MHSVNNLRAKYQHDNDKLNNLQATEPPGPSLLWLKIAASYMEINMQVFSIFKVYNT